MWGDVVDGILIMAKVVGKFNIQPQSPPTDVPDEYKKICKDCTDYEPTKRPSAAEILEYFTS